MKPNRLVYLLSYIWALAILLAGLDMAKGNPFASCLTVTNGSVQFYLNEGGGTVTVTYEDGSTNSVLNGQTTMAAGAYSFNLTDNSVTHTSYAITCFKTGTGTPFQISSDTNPYDVWHLPHGVDANKNPKNGANFGRIYVGESIPGGTGATYKAQGIYMLSPDLGTNLAPGGGTNVLAGGMFTVGATNSPYRLTVGPDDNVYVADFSTPNATVFAFDPTFSSFTNVVLNPVGENQGLAAGTHGDISEVFITGSLATSNLSVYTFDPALPLSRNAALFYVDSGGDDVYHVGSEGISLPGSYNNVYEYNIGGGPLPWTNPPDHGVNVGLPSFADSQIGSVTVEPNGYIVVEFNRSNFSDGDVQVYDTNFNLLYSSLQFINGANFDAFNNGTGYGYAGVRVSPDGQYLLTVSSAENINVCYLVDGIPDTTSLIKIATSPTTSFSRGCAFDAADNIIYVSDGQGLLRYYSLGYTSTCVTSNDYTGTNGTFSLTLPSARASLAVTAPTASQNYINNPTPGTPTSAAFAITLSTNTLSAPLTVNFTMAGTAANNVNYTLNLGTNADGVIIKANSVIFPAGTYMEGGNWTVNILVTPTATPLSGPTLTVTATLAGGQAYIPQEPLLGSMTILNTGPQQLVLSAITTANAMSRETPNDYAEFIVTRNGDLSQSYTVTNFTLTGTALFPADYTAGPQNVAFPPVNGNGAISISSGVNIFTNMIGNPVSRTNFNEPPTNVTIIVSLTNAVTGTNNTSQEGLAYTVTTASVTLTEYDNAFGNEIVLWSDSLTNPASSTNWTVTFDTPLLGTNTVLPVVLTNYTNGETTKDFSGTNDFGVYFGDPLANIGVEPSPFMEANGWTSVLFTTVNNYNGVVAGVNVLPQGVNFYGNYALRFDMYLNLYSFAAQDPYYSGVAARQFALWGINNRGTNCDWRPTYTVIAGNGPGKGSGATNWDGQWFAADAGTDSQTPADFDALSPTTFPNAGGSDLVDTHYYADTGLFKSPPFAAYENTHGTFGGQPVDQWVNVEADTLQNAALQKIETVTINHTPIFSSFTNVSMFTNGTVMLGYESPLPNAGDGSEFALYSHMRVVELAPYVLTTPASVIVTNGQTFTLTGSATYATAPLSNIWYAGAVPVQTNSAGSSNMIGSLTVTNVAAGAAYASVFADAAGRITNTANVEVITAPLTVTAFAGDTVKLAATASGPAAPTGYHWKIGGTNLVNSTHYAGVATATLMITNVTSTDAGTYTISATNAAGTVNPTVRLIINPTPQPLIGNASLSGTNVVMSFSTTDTSLAAKSFLLLSSPIVNGPYTTNTSAVITGANGSFQIVVPKTTNSAMFYQVVDN
jgi:hypothetical protein